MSNFHGEYKTSGGKLVAVDFSVDDGVIHDVVVHGDFFLYPEEALVPITASLEGALAHLPEGELAARIARSIPEGTAWLGSSPEALASAVRRALVIDDNDV